ncbi:BnaA09g17450D [Brassica napus]|uniref:BnaA09g17450D protein n=1 Tax=Brassica napus TaxID=3708 RepID=A0A078FJD1_BRANA|nr:BnaA09g17450D [Brassica napus]
MTYSQEAGTIRKNGYIVIKGRPCKVVEASTSKLDIVLSSHNCDVPHVNYTDYTFLYIFDDGFVSVLTENGPTKGVKCPPLDESLLTQINL